jgi:hypothetical protein
MMQSLTLAGFYNDAVGHVLCLGNTPQPSLPYLTFPTASRRVEFSGILFAWRTTIQLECVCYSGRYVTPAVSSYAQQQIITTRVT